MVVFFQNSAKNSNLLSKDVKKLFSKNVKIVIFFLKSAIFEAGKMVHAVPLSGQRWTERVIGFFDECMHT